METLSGSTVNKREKIESTLNGIYNLPALPDIVSDALRLLNSKSTSNNQILDLISKEQSFVAKVLALANSPIYGLRKEVSTLDFAIMVLGFNELRHIIFVISFLESFRSQSSKYFDQNNYWLHSLITANVSKRLAEDFGYGRSGEAFIAGFLHDIGVSISHRYFKNSFIEIREYVEKTNVSFMDAEMEVLGMTHSDIGHYLADKWHLPAVIKTATKFHHAPELDPEDGFLASIVHLADYLSYNINSSKLFWEKDFVVSEFAFEKLKITEDKKTNFIDKYSSVIEDDQDLMRILS